MPPTMGNQPPVPPPPQAPPPVAAAKKKTSPLVWVLVGCLGLFVIGGVIFAAATFFVAKKVKDVASEFAENPIRESVEAMVRFNPELELVSTDDEAETLTIRNKSTGEVATFDWSDIQNGNFRFEADGEEYTVDTSGAAEGRLEVRDGSGAGVLAFGPGASDVPSWFPEYPGSADVNVLVSANQNGQDSAIWTFQAADAVADVLAFYEQRLEVDGWEVSTSTAEGAGAQQGSVEAKRDAGATTLNLVATSGGGEGTQVMVTYTGTGG